MGYFNFKKKQDKDRVYYPLFVLWLIFVAVFSASLGIGLLLHSATIMKFTDGVLAGWVVLLLLFAAFRTHERLLNILPASFKERWKIGKYPPDERAARVKAEIYSLQGFLSCVILLGILGLALAMFSLDCIGSQLYTHPSAFMDELRKRTCAAGIKPALIIGSLFGLFMWFFALIVTLKNKILSNLLFLLLLILVSLDFLGYPFLEPIMSKLLY